MYLQLKLFNYFTKGYGTPWYVQIAFLLVVYGAVVLGMWNILRGHIPADGYLDINRKDWLTALFIAVVVFAISNLSFVSKDTPFSGEYMQEIANIRTLVDIAGVAILYAHFVLCCKNKTRMELEAVQNVLENQYIQYKQSRESIELINYKYHDLKHQIEMLSESSYKDTLAINEMILNTAEREIERLEKGGIYAQGRSFRDVVDVNRAAITKLDTSRGFSLNMSWNEL